MVESAQKKKLVECHHSGVATLFEQFADKNFIIKLFENPKCWIFQYPFWIHLFENAEFCVNSSQKIFLPYLIKFLDGHKITSKVSDGTKGGLCNQS